MSQFCMKQKDKELSYKGKENYRFDESRRKFDWSDQKLAILRRAMANLAEEISTLNEMDDDQAIEDIDEE